MNISNFKRKFAIVVSAATLALAGNAAHAFGMMDVGDWEVEFSGNVDGFFTSAECDPEGGDVLGGLACGSNGGERDISNIQTGLLPSWFGFHAQTTKNEFDVGITIGFQPGIDGGNQSGGLDSALGGNSENLRQVFLEFGQKSWGKVKVGRDLGLYGSDGILKDMTLLGVGTISDISAGGGNTTLGRIGVGYLYADWKAQIQYASPKWFDDKFSFNLALVDPWGVAPGLTSNETVSHSAASFAQESDTPGIEGKVNVDPIPWLSLWAGFINQAIDTRNAAFSNATATGFDIGASVQKTGIAWDPEFVAYFYAGEGIGTTGFLWDAVSVETGNERDSDGFYVQATVKPWGTTKFGVSFGQSNLDLASGETASELVETNESLVLGVYHPLNDALHLVLEYTGTEASAHNGNEAEESSIAVGAILFY